MTRRWPELLEVVFRRQFAGKQPGRQAPAQPPCLSGTSVVTPICISLISATSVADLTSARLPFRLSEKVILSALRTWFQTCHFNGLLRPAAEGACASRPICQHRVGNNASTCERSDGIQLRWQRRRGF